MCNSFGSSLWMLPFSAHCKVDSVHWKHVFEEKGGVPHNTYRCDHVEYQKNYSGWPANIVNIEIPCMQGAWLYFPINNA